MSYKLDLHTHSYGSPDGGLKAPNYRYFLQNNLLDYIAITDHNGVETAQQIQSELGELGSRIIVGQEVMTDAGEIIGLYLTRTIEPGLTPLQTAKAIKEQGGLVYIPHPFETVRSGLQPRALNEIAGEVDVVETCNGRAVFQNQSRAALAWARSNGVPGAASSDTHGRFGWGHTFSVVNHVPDVENLGRILANASYSTRTVGWGVLYPKLNRLRKSFGGGK